MKGSEPVKEADYQWSEDGVIEHGLAEGRICTSETSCYHCGRKIIQGAMFMRFLEDSGDAYDLCMPCSKRSIRYSTERKI